MFVNTCSSCNMILCHLFRNPPLGYNMVRWWSLWFSINHAARQRVKLLEAEKSGPTCRWSSLSVSWCPSHAWILSAFKVRIVPRKHSKTNASPLTINTEPSMELPHSHLTQRWDVIDQLLHQLNRSDLISLYEIKTIKIAKSWANNLADKALFEHSPKDLRGYRGENLGGSESTRYSCASGVKSWYDEVQYYDYKQPGFSTRTGHFTVSVSGYRPCLSSIFQSYLSLTASGVEVDNGIGLWLCSITQRNLFGVQLCSAGQYPWWIRK